MKLSELFNNYQNQYFNVLPPRNVKSAGSMIAAVMRATADEMGNEDTEAQASKLWPNNKYDRRQYDDTAKSIVQKVKKLRKKQVLAGPKEMELVIDKNRTVKDSPSVIYR